MRPLKYILHSHALESGVFGSVEIQRQPEMTDRLMRMRVEGRLDLRHLRALLGEPASMRVLRAMMVEAGGVGVDRRSDRDVLAWFAARIAARRLHLAAAQRATPAPAVATKGSSTTSPAESAISTPPDPPRRAPTPRPPAPPPQPATAAAPPPPSPQTFGHVDQDLQAAVLEAAARAGTPFCEECNRHAG